LKLHSLTGEGKGGEERSDELTTQFMIEVLRASLSDTSVPKLNPSGRRFAPPPQDHES